MQIHASSHAIRTDSRSRYDALTDRQRLDWIAPAEHREQLRSWGKDSELLSMWFVRYSLHSLLPHSHRSGWPTLPCVSFRWIQEVRLRFSRKSITKSDACPSLAVFSDKWNSDIAISSINSLPSSMHLQSMDRLTAKWGNCDYSSRESSISLISGEKDSSTFT